MKKIVPFGLILLLGSFGTIAACSGTDTNSKSYSLKKFVEFDQQNWELVARRLGSSSKAQREAHTSIAKKIVQNKVLIGLNLTELTLLFGDYSTLDSQSTILHGCNYYYMFNYDAQLICISTNDEEKVIKATILNS